MSTALNDSPTREHIPSSKHTQNSLTAGQMPRWVWAVVAAAALLVALGLELLIKGEEFRVARLAVMTLISYVVGMYIVTRLLENRRKATDGLWRNLVWAAFLIALVPLISVIWSVISDGAPTLFGNPQVLWNDMDGVTGTTDAAYLNDGQPLGGLPGGFAHALVGTLMITLIATLIAVPIGLLTSIYLVEYGRDGWLSRSIIFFVDVMTGIPSIVAGLFAFAAMSLLLELVMGEGPKALQSVKMGLTAAVALTVLMIPVVVRSTEEMLRVVPNELREGSYALGVRKWRTISKVVIPTAISGILSGITLAIARVTGETAPILVTAGFATTMNWNPMDNWMTALPVYIYRQLVSPTSPTAYDVSTDRAWAAALVLIIIVMALNLIARMIAKAFAPKTGR
ncbi:phosphate ABC transporter permease PstA [Micrococcus sp. EYE_162]|uniref:phosphate ABC transporter permease PstA n=1 Tax=unclassified Micrococcus TaxID=2620948 RepID=UPI0020066BBB|nr:MULTISPECIES: phosphate ABC transporter permease PstA [unclassified Micrococcus]MCK6096071.1 phosphate ABC transporter permease PstA [Micrococcus sp. EYE_212]MCK6172162.1 phosphate ABC transporter permease PstA [Micrococcus sp. EYE_162]